MDGNKKLGGDMPLYNDEKRFLYKGGVETARIFEAGEIIPEGYFDGPNFTKWDNPPKQPEKPEVKKIDELLDKEFETKRPGRPRKIKQ